MRRVLLASAALAVIGYGVFAQTTGGGGPGTGGGGGGGGAITAASGSYAAGALSAGAGVDGWDVTEGSTTDAAATAGGTGSVSAKLRLMTTELNTVATNTTQAPTGSVPPANTNYIGASSSGNLTGIVVCDHHAFAHITSATDTMLVAHVAAKTVKVCGYKVSFAATNTVFLEQSTADACTSPTQIAGADSGVAQSVFGFYNATWGGLVNTSGDALCVNSSGSGAVDVDVWYTQGS